MELDLLQMQLVLKQYKRHGLVFLSSVCAVKLNRNKLSYSNVRSHTTVNIH